MGWYPNPMAAKKKSHLLLFLGVVGCSVLLVFFAVSSNTDKGEKQAATSSQTSQTAEQPQAVAPAGSTVRHGQLEFVVGWQGRSKKETLVSKPLGEWYVVHVAVENIGDEQQSFFPQGQKLIDSQGREYKADLMAAYSMNNEAMAELNPGLGAVFAVPFDVPVGTVPVAIELTDAATSLSGVRVSLK
jgi:hypothetical protein